MKSLDQIAASESAAADELAKHLAGHPTWDAFVAYLKEEGKTLGKEALESALPLLLKLALMAL